jgi:hypothetical protein
LSDSLPDDPGWNAEVLRGGAAAIVERKRRSVRPLVKYGSGRLTRLLVEYHLIDQFQFWIFPVRIGRGRRLFEDLDGPAPPLTLTGTRTLASGVVILSYTVGAEPTSGTFPRQAQWRHVHETGEMPEELTGAVQEAIGSSTDGPDRTREDKS